MVVTLVDKAFVRSFATLVRIKEFTPSYRKPLSGSETHRGILRLKQLAIIAFNTLRDGAAGK